MCRGWFSERLLSKTRVILQFLSSSGGRNIHNRSEVLSESLCWFFRGDGCKWYFFSGLLRYASVPCMHRMSVPPPNASRAILLQLVYPWVQTYPWCCRLTFLTCKTALASFPKLSFSVLRLELCKTLSLIISLKAKLILKCNSSLWLFLLRKNAQYMNHLKKQQEKICFWIVFNNCVFQGMCGRVKTWLFSLFLVYHFIVLTLLSLRNEARFRFLPLRSMCG